MPTALESRPASRVSLRSRSMPAVRRLRLSIGKAGLLGIGYQASPYLAVRRSAGPDSPPTQIGMPPFCVGLGAKVILSKATYWPENFGRSLVHSSLKAATYSSVTLPRSAKGGAPIASNSSFIQPAP